uniref:Aminoadipate-semialdehyde dehydrogenase n=1 Tax=Sphenodon punctatus TaxID=8508 RepID=A0A8D0LCY2_SPHPU
LLQKFKISYGKWLYKDSLETEHVAKTSKACMDVRQRHTLAYVLHTSGTTGIPKIVRVPHKCIVPNIHHLRTIFGIMPGDVVFMASPLTFDPSVVELFVALTSGASLLIVPNPIKMMPQKLSEALFHQHRVTVLQATPTFLKRFGSQCIKSTVLSANTSLRVLALGGEAFPELNVLRNWIGKGNKTCILNIYESSLYFLPFRDANGSVILEGEGQVFIGGNDRICFLDDEVTVPLGTMRETGDFARVKDAEIFFLGRKDNQIKRHGKRLNIEYVQQIAEGLHHIETCAVTWYRQEKLILFIIPKVNLSGRDTLKALQEQLPGHAVPDEIVQVEALPFTLHGKIDVSELKKIYSNHLNSRRHDSKLSRKEELWERLQYLWKCILSLPEDPCSISKDSMFLYSGGDSLKALRFHDEIENLVGRVIPGLLEVILSNNITEVYRHILKVMFPNEDQIRNCDSSMKRKLNETSKEEFSEKHMKPNSGSYLSAEAELGGFIMLSRGNQLVSPNFSVCLENQSNIGQAGIELRQQVAYLPAESFNVRKNKTRGTEIVKSRSGPTIASGTGTDSIEQTPVQENLRKVAQKLLLCVRWKSDMGKCVDASPLVLIPASAESSSSVYIGSHSHTIHAIELDSGQVKWERMLGDRIESSACLSRCGNFIIVGCYNGLVYVLRSNTGEIHWTFTTENAVKSSAAVDPSTGLAYVGSHDQHVYALDVYEEECVWKLHCEGGAVFSSPCLSLLPHHLYIATLGGLLWAVNPALGDKIWKRSCGKPLFSSPRCNEHYVCVGCVDGKLYCFNHSGEKVWQFSTNGPIFSSPCMSSCAKQEIFFGSHDCCVYCCNMEGDLRWKFETTSSVYATPFVFHCHNSKRKMLLAITSTDGKVWILNAKTGLVVCVEKLPGEVFSSPVVWGTRLIVGCRNNYVYCLDLCTAEINKTN